MRRLKRQNGVYAYLDKLGLLSTGTPEQIAVAKADYWKKVRKDWQKNKRTANKKFEVFLNSMEHQIIAKEAKVAGRSRVSYIKESALAYTQKKYLVPRQEILYDLKELLALTYDALQAMIEEKNVPVGLGDILLTRIEELENRVLTLLFNPTEIK